MNEIISAKHICERDGAKTLRQWIIKTARQFRGLPAYTGRVSGLSVAAKIEAGRWLAACISPDCGGHEYIRQDEPIFYCFTCGNRSNGGDARPVTFPENWREIETALLQRPVVLSNALTEMDALLNAKPHIAGLLRWWLPPASLSELIEQNEKAGIR